MKEASYPTRLWVVLALIFAQVAGAPAGSIDAPETAKMAARMVRGAGLPGGIISVIGARDAGLAMALARQGSFTVHCLVADRDLCDRLRKEIRARGIYGTVSVDTYAGGPLPYAANLLNLVVVDSYPTLGKAGPSAEEVRRVLAPLGTAYLGSSQASSPQDWGAGGAGLDDLAGRTRATGMTDVSVVNDAGAWVKASKPWPAEIDEWGHFLHGADGNPVARDTVVGPPKHWQWVSGPVYLRSHETDSSVATLVTSRGRLFSIIDEAPISLAGQNSPPDKWSLVAQDAFNGTLLWKVPIRRWGWREWRSSWFNTRPGDIPLNLQKRLVAAGDRVYITLGYGAPVSQLDAATGQVLQTYAGTEGTNEILHLNGTLVLSVVSGDQVKLMAADAASGRRLWLNDKGYRGSTVDYIKWKEMGGGTEPAKLDPASNIATDGNAIALIDGPEIACLDFKTGAERWHAPFPSDPEDARSGGIATGGNLWVGTMIVTDGVVLCASPNKLAGLSAQDGRLLWERPKKYIGHLWYEWKDNFVIDGLVWTWGPDLVREKITAGERTENPLYPQTAFGYDIHTGEVKKQVALGAIFKANHHHRCYRDKATSRFILASRRGSEYVDLAGGKHVVDNWVRGTCHVGMMPANGMQYAPPHPCQCYIEEKLNGMMALAPAGDEPRFEETPALERGPAYGQVPSPQSAVQSPEDWPVYRHDSARTASTAAAVPEKLAPLWGAKLGGRVTPPIVVGGRVYTAQVDQHHVLCLDGRTGKTLWEFAAGGRVDSPPTYHKGALLFGSADGWVYCVRASDGWLAWRFHAAPANRLMASFGQLESAWPVNGSVLVHGDTVYFAAGRTSHLDGGMRLYGIDAATGKLLHQTKIEGPEYDSDNIQQNFGLPMGALPDILVADGDTLYMRNNAFDLSLQPRAGKPVMQVRGGFLDDTYFKRAPWTLGTGESFARLIVHDDKFAYYFRQFDTLRGLDPTVFFTPGAKGYQLFARPVSGKGEGWSERIPVRVRTMALAGGRLFAAGPPDVVDPKDPLGAFEGRKGGRLCVYDTADGAKKAEYGLASPPVFNGAAAAGGRLYVAQEDGTVTCFGGK